MKRTAAALITLISISILFFLLFLFVNPLSVWGKTGNNGSNPGSSEQRASNPGFSNEETVRLIVLLDKPALGARGLIATKQQAGSLTKLQAETINTQNEVINSLERHGVKIEAIGYRYTLLLNGFELTAYPDDLDAIASVAGVKAVYEDGLFQVTLADSVPLIGADKVWQMQDRLGNPVTGKDVKVAVLDTGIDYTHADLGGCFGAGCKVVGGYDYVNNDGDPMDDNINLFSLGHGTHVSGIIAANGQVKGVAPQANLLAYKVCHAQGWCQWGHIIAALEQAVVDQADVANISIGGLGSTDDPVAQAVNAAVDQGVTVVIGAGNDRVYRSVNSPGLAAKAITVGATTKQDELAIFTSKGPVDEYFIKPDLLAPGEDIYSTGIGNQYFWASGTSMSSPHVAGAAALIKQLHPDWTPEMIKAGLMNSARHLGSDPYAEGAGRLQVDQAAQADYLVIPGSLSLGRIDRSLPVWSATGTLRVANLSGAVQEYDIFDRSDLPDGFSFEINPSHIALEAGQSQEVTVSVAAEVDSVPYPGSQPYAFYGHVGITDGQVEKFIPFAIAAPIINCQLQNDIPVSECEALWAIYDATNGQNWVNKTGWQDIGPCGWYGVFCNGGHVTDLALARNNLSGYLPPEIGQLTYLSSLDLFENEIEGYLPPEIGNLVNLRSAVMFTNRFSGSIPVEIGNLIGLETLILSSNQLSGDLPSSMINLVNLYEFYIDHNMLTASDPGLIAFLDSRSPGWDLTQTVPPENLQAVALSDTSVRLSWSPIKYTEDGGYYSVAYSTSPGGPYTLHGTTPDKTASAYVADGLVPDTDYYFVISTFTPAHGQWQKNDLYSAYTPEAWVRTRPSSPPDLVVKAINWVQDMPGLDQPITFTVIVKNRGKFPVPAGQMPVLDVYLDHQPQGCGDRSAVISEAVIPYAMPAGDIWFHVFTFPGFSQPGEHQVWAFVDTDCQVKESNEANNTLGPVTVDVLKFLIFKDGFETGDTSAWSKCHTGGRDLTVTRAAALSGSFGLAARLDNKGPIYCTSKQAKAEAQVQARFLLDPNSLRMAQGDRFTVYQALQGGRSVLQIELLRDSNRYRLRASTLEDGKNWRSGRWIFIEDRPQEVEFFWQAATRPDRTNGVLSLWIDGSRRTFISDLDNHTRRIDRVNLGAVSGVDKGTRGTFFLDDYVSRRDNYAISP